MARADLVLAALEQRIAGKMDADPAVSYVGGLCQGDEDALLKKIVEEAAEVVLAAKSGNTSAIESEAADLVFHLMIMLAQKGIGFTQVTDRLHQRAGVSGLVEKSLRSTGKSS